MEAWKKVIEFFDKLIVMVMVYAVVLTLIISIVEE